MQTCGVVSVFPFSATTTTTSSEIYSPSFPPLIPNCDSHFILVKMESLSRIRKKASYIFFLGKLILLYTRRRPDRMVRELKKLPQS